RLKPVVTASVAASVDPTIAGSATGSMTEKPNVDDFFSFATARVTALECIKEILVIANRRAGAARGVGRNAVPLSVWEGTTWLLREEDAGVRRSYVDALTTYLMLEIDRAGIIGTPGAPKKVNISLLSSIIILFD